MSVVMTGYFLICLRSTDRSYNAQVYSNKIIFFSSGSSSWSWMHAFGFWGWTASNVVSCPTFRQNLQLPSSVQKVLFGCFWKLYIATHMSSSVCWVWCNEAAARSFTPKISISYMLPFDTLHEFSVYPGMRFKLFINWTEHFNSCKICQHL
jgi:hypothetical protein